MFHVVNHYSKSFNRYYRFTIYLYAFNEINGVGESSVAIEIIQIVGIKLIYENCIKQK